MTSSPSHAGLSNVSFSSSSSISATVRPSLLPWNSSISHVWPSYSTIYRVFSMMPGRAWLMSASASSSGISRSHSNREMPAWLFALNVMKPCPPRVLTLRLRSLSHMRYACTISECETAERLYSSERTRNFLSISVFFMLCIFPLTCPRGPRHSGLRLRKCLS